MFFLDFVVFCKCLFELLYFFILLCFMIFCLKSYVFLVVFTRFCCSLQVWAMFCVGYVFDLVALNNT